MKIDYQYLVKTFSKFKEYDIIFSQIDESLDTFKKINPLIDDGHINTMKNDISKGLFNNFFKLIESSKIEVNNKSVHTKTLEFERDILKSNIDLFINYFKEKKLSYNQINIFLDIIYFLISIIKLVINPIKKICHFNIDFYRLNTFKISKESNRILLI